MTCLDENGHVIPGSDAGVTVYRVGLWRDWSDFRRRHHDWRRFRRALGREVRYLRAGEWHTVKSYFNGWLAEPVSLPDGFVRCGSGWTLKRARRDLDRRLERMSPNGNGSSPHE